MLDGAEKSRLFQFIEQVSDVAIRHPEFVRERDLRGEAATIFACKTGKTSIEHFGTRTDTVISNQSIRDEDPCEEPIGVERGADPKSLRMAHKSVLPPNRLPKGTQRVPAQFGPQVC